MSQIFRTDTVDECFVIMTADSDDPIVSLSVKSWDTEFFGRRTGGISLRSGALKGMDNAELTEIVALLSRHAEEAGFELVEFHMNTVDVALVPALEAAGFRMVDTRITYVTPMQKQECELIDPPFGKLRMATKNDLDEILALTHQGLTNNPGFHSRMKNRDYFTPEQTEQYFGAWIRNHIEDDDAMFAAWERDGRVIGYFIYRRVGDYEGEGLYKGLLASVAPECRGHHGLLIMQSYLFQHMPDDCFYVDNTTQLSNYAVIRNHIKGQRILDRIELTFFWKSH